MMDIGRGHKKASDQQVLDAYTQEGSCRKAAEALGMGQQAVHERLVRLGVDMAQRRFSKAEEDILRAQYSTHAHNGTLGQLAQMMGRTKPYLCRQAGKLGLTDSSRPKPYAAETMSKTMRGHRAINGHPRGALGMKHTDETRATLSEKAAAWHASLTEDQKGDIIIKRLKTKVENGTSAGPRIKTTWKAGWREIGGVRKYYRSKWEANYAHYLQWLKDRGDIADWKHEPETFWFDGIKRGCVSYLPDFWVKEIGGSEAYHEVKGWMDDRSATKIKRMAKYHPKVKLIVIDAKGYAALKKSVQALVPGWED
jgi:hypothetical protein